MQVAVHYFLHFGLPVLIAWLFFKSEWKWVSLLLLSTMLVDLDHVFANPMFQANRCSINFHPLHHYVAMGGYVLLLFFKRPFRVLGIGLLLHMATDLLDCVLTYSRCEECLVTAPAKELVEWIANRVGL